MIERTINNWKYSVSDNYSLSIEPPENLKKEVPETLYKYYSLSEYSLQVLEKLEIFASHPKILNDPFDTHDSLIKFDDKDSIKTFLGQTLQEPEFKEAFEKNPDSLKGFVQYNFRTVLYGRLGIYSMTEKPTNLLMWSYYTGHKGFCLEFNYKQFPFKFHGPFQINYQDKFIPISIRHGGHICMLYQSNLKAADWAHEGEWRILPEREGPKSMELRELDALKDFSDVTSRNFPISRACISKIILGNLFFDNDNELTPTNEGLVVTLKTNVDFKNRLLDVIHNLDLPVDLIFRNEPNFGFRTETLQLERQDKNQLIIKKRWLTT